MELPKVYDAATDELVDVTQKWCDTASKALNALGTKTTIIKIVSDLKSGTNYPEDINKLHQILNFLTSMGLEH